MKNLKKTIFFIVLSLSLMSNIMVFAELPEKPLDKISSEISITPQWVNTNNILLNLYFESGQAKCSGIIAGVPGTSNIKATFKLERKGLLGWTLEKSWDKSSKSETLTFSESDSVTKGTYRLSVTAKVTRNGITETVSTNVESKY